MAKVKDILQFMDTLAPAYMKEDWDHVGLNCGHLDAPVKKILVALDPFDHVCQEAKDLGADLLITHHALIWDPGFVTDETATGKRTLFLIENGIAHINAHTNLDQAPGGVNEVLAKKLNLQSSETVAQHNGYVAINPCHDLKQADVIAPAGTDAEGRPYGLLRCGYTHETDLDSFLQYVKEKLGTPTLRFVRGGKPVHKVAVGGGSCAGAMHLAVEAGCDTFVTADVKYNQFWDAKTLGLNLIDAGHFYTENPIVSYLAAALTLNFSEIEICISKTHRDCMEFA